MNFFNKITLFLYSDEGIESAIAFCTGDLLATLMIINLLPDVAFPIILSVITGFLGGAFAILGKIVVKWILRKKEEK